MSATFLTEYSRLMAELVSFKMQRRRLRQDPRYFKEVKDPKCFFQKPLCPGPGKITVVPMISNLALVDLAVRICENVVGRRAEIIPSEILPDGLWGSFPDKFLSLNADKLLEHLWTRYMCNPGSDPLSLDDRTVFLTDCSIFGERHPRLYGYASYNLRVCVVSTALLGTPELESNFFKVILHELCHTFDLPHCEATTSKMCVMGEIPDDGSLEEVAYLPCFGCECRMKESTKTT